MENKLLIGIISQEETGARTEKIKNELRRQMVEHKTLNRVKISTFPYGGDFSNEKKMNRNIKHAVSFGYEYVCFIDDSDWITEDYLIRILNATLNGQDAIGFNLKITSANLAVQLSGSVYWQIRKDSVFHNFNHLTPVKSKIAEACLFDLEDTGVHDYAKKINSLIKTSSYIDRIIYHKNVQ